MSYLLDVNVLIALLDSDHTFYDQAHIWFERHAGEGWATCPITENGALRILSNSRYPRDFGTPGAVALVLQSLREVDGHEFWPDDLSLLASSLVDLEAVTTSARVTDAYLLALAVSKRGRFATFDRRVSAGPVRGGADAIHIISDR